MVKTKDEIAANSLQYLYSIGIEIYLVMCRSRSKKPEAVLNRVIWCYYLLRECYDYNMTAKIIGCSTSHITYLNAYRGIDVETKRKYQYAINRIKHPPIIVTMPDKQEKDYTLQFLLDTFSRYQPTKELLKEATHDNGHLNNKPVDLWITPYCSF